MENEWATLKSFIKERIPESPYLHSMGSFVYEGILEKMYKLEYGKSLTEAGY